MQTLQSERKEGGGKYKRAGREERKKERGEFPGGLVVGIQHLLCWGLGLIPGLGTKISHQGAAHQGQERERERGQNMKRQKKEERKTLKTT